MKRDMLDQSADPWTLVDLICSAGVVVMVLVVVFA